jgi:hypothetical protein
VDIDVDSAVDDCAEGLAVQPRHDNLADKIHGRQCAKVLGSTSAHGRGSKRASKVVGDIAAVVSATSSDSDVSIDVSAGSGNDPQQDEASCEKGCDILRVRGLSGAALGFISQRRQGGRI